MNEFGNFLSALRKRGGMTQQELADKLGVTNKAISKWETGEAFPDTALLVPLANIFGITVDELLRGREETKATQAPLDENKHKDVEDAKAIKKHVRAMIAHRLSGVIMMSATLMYLVMGFVWELWHPGWIVFPIGGIICGILNIIWGKTD